MSKEDTVTVCDNCFRASCWNGVFYCDEANYAGTVEKTREELEQLNLEHPDYWEEETYQRLLKRGIK